MLTFRGNLVSFEQKRSCRNGNNDCDAMHYKLAFAELWVWEPFSPLQFVWLIMNRVSCSRWWHDIHINFGNAASEFIGFAMTISGTSEVLLRSNGFLWKLTWLPAEILGKIQSVHQTDISLSEKLGKKNNIWRIGTEEREIMPPGFWKTVNPGSRASV